MKLEIVQGGGIIHVTHPLHAQNISFLLQFYV